MHVDIPHKTAIKPTGKSLCPFSITLKLRLWSFDRSTSHLALIMALRPLSGWSAFFLIDVSCMKLIPTLHRNYLTGSDWQYMLSPEATGQLLHSEVGSNQVARTCTWQRSVIEKSTLGSPKKFQHLTRAEVVVITRLWIGHIKAAKSPILSHGPRTACHHWGQTLTIDFMLLECAVLQECRGEYNTVDSLNILFEAIPETCIVEFLREAGLFYLIWCNLLISTSPETWTIWSDLRNLFSKSGTHLLV